MMRRPYPPVFDNITQYESHDANRNRKSRSEQFKGSEPRSARSLDNRSRYEPDSSDSEYWAPQVQSRRLFRESRLQPRRSSNTSCVGNLFGDCMTTDYSIDSRTVESPISTGETSFESPSVRTRAPTHRGYVSGEHITRHAISPTTTERDEHHQIVSYVSGDHRSQLSASRFTASSAGQHATSIVGFTASTQLLRLTNGPNHVSPHKGSASAFGSPKQAIVNPFVEGSGRHLSPMQATQHTVTTPPLSPTTQRHSAQYEPSLKRLADDDWIDIFLKSTGNSPMVVACRVGTLRRFSSYFGQLFPSESRSTANAGLSGSGFHRQPVTRKQASSCITLSIEDCDIPEAVAMLDKMHDVHEQTQGDSKAVPARSIPKEFDDDNESVQDSLYVNHPDDMLISDDIPWSAKTWKLCLDWEMHRPIQKLAHSLTQFVVNVIETIRSHHWRSNDQALAHFRVLTFDRRLHTHVSTTVIGLPIGEIIQSASASTLSPVQHNVQKQFDGVLARFDAPVKHTGSGTKGKFSAIKRAVRSMGSPPRSHSSANTAYVKEPFLILPPDDEEKDEGQEEEWMDADEYSEQILTTVLSEEEIKQFWLMISAVVSLCEIPSFPRHLDTLVKGNCLASTVTLLADQTFTSSTLTGDSFTSESSTFTLPPPKSSINRTNLQAQLLKAITPNGTVGIFTSADLGKLLARKEYRILRTFPDAHQLVPPALWSFCA